MISEGLCETEDWINGCWKFSLGLDDMAKIYITIYFVISVDTI